MTHQTTYIKTSDGLMLFLQVWKPVTRPICVINLVHGINEHSSRYDTWARTFVRNNIAVVAVDQRGHGQSEGKSGVIPSYDSLLNDIDLVLLECKHLFPGISVVLYGHSLGGGEVLNHTLSRKNTYKGVIATSPWLISQKSPHWFFIPLIHLLHKGFPNMRIKNYFNPSLLYRDKKGIAEYANDPLMHSWISIRLFYQAYRAGYNALNRASDLRTPVLLLHGSKDKITLPKASKIFAEKAGPLCQFVSIHNGYHELHNDFCKTVVFNLIIKWIRVTIPNDVVISSFNPEIDE